MSLSEALLTTALLLCRSLHAEALQATAREGLAQGPYFAARVGFESATLQVDSKRRYRNTLNELIECVFQISSGDPSGNFAVCPKLETVLQRVLDPGRHQPSQHCRF